MPNPTQTKENIAVDIRIDPETGNVFLNLSELDRSLYEIDVGYFCELTRRKGAIVIEE